jgi:hypothetical protein
MSMEHRHQSASPQPVLSIIFYGLAVLTLALGVFIGLACLNAPGAFQPIIGMLQMPLVDLFVKPLMNSLIVLGILAFVCAAVACVLLIAFGRLLARAAHLSRRVARVEAALVHARLLRDCPVLDEAREQVLEGITEHAVH